MAYRTRFSADRRDFMKQAALAGVAFAAPVVPAQSAAQSGSTDSSKSGTGNDARSPDIETLTEGRSGSDFMVDVIKSLGLEYICSNTGSSFRGLQESIINYGSNKAPEFLTCCHEESSVAMAHGYFKVDGKPLGVFAHGTVGLQHAAMAIYNAWVDRVPVIIVIGNTLDANLREPPSEWAHSAQDPVLMVRDYIKWDDQPVSLQHFAESMVRAYHIAMTGPKGPVVISADSELQERPIPEPDGSRLRIPKLTRQTPPQGDAAAVAEAARLLVAAEHPVLLVDRLVHTAEGMQRLVELAELLQASVIDTRARLNFPSHHALNGAALTIHDADVICGFEVSDMFGRTHQFKDLIYRTTQPTTTPGAKVITIGLAHLTHKSNYQDFQRYAEADLAISGDGEATLPVLIDAVKREITGDRKRVIFERGAKLAGLAQQALERARASATIAWDASPISTARLSTEIWAQIRQEDWVLANNGIGVPTALWNFDKHYRAIGSSGGGGMGYGSPATVGAALANRQYGRLTVNIQGDGDFMYAPGVLWTAAHHRIPLLTVMHNNRAYHQEMMHLQRMGNRRNRGIDRAHIGTTIDDPAIDYAKLAQALGWYAEGPITNPNELSAAIKRAVAVVKRGEPALLDVVTQPR